MAIEVCLYKVIVSELGLSSRIDTPSGDTPSGEGVTKALATHTGRCFECNCSRRQVWDVSGNAERLGMCTHAITSNSLDGGFLTVLTRETTIGEGDGCD